jgi:LacI family transcriptional regulator
MADGYIIRHSRDPEHDRALLSRLRRNGVPFIFIGTPEEKDARAIMVDNIGGAREMAHHFVDHSFRKILFITGAPDNLDSNDRVHGFRMGLSEKGFDLASLCTAQGDFSRDCGYRIAEEMLARGVDAVFAANDRMALGVLHYLNERGIRVPRDVALAGFDDTFFSEYLWPPLTTVRQPMHEIGAVAMENMVMAIEGATISAARIILPTRLVIRESCGCSPALPAMHPEEMNQSGERGLTQ